MLGKEILTPENSGIKFDQLWQIPYKTVLAYSEEKIPQIHGLVENWLNLRPTLVMPYSETNYIAPRAQDPFQRDREFISMANHEAFEFVSAYLLKDEKGLRSELGDTLFSLMVPSINNWMGTDSVEYLILKEADIKKMDPKFQEMTRGVPAEMGIFLAANMTDRLAGSSDGFDMVMDINEFDKKGNVRLTAFEKSLNFTLNSITRYSIAKNWDLMKVVQEVRTKNDNNFPIYLFNSDSPFAIHKDAVLCLRLLRKYVFANPDLNYHKKLSQLLGNNFIFSVHKDRFITRSYISSVLHNLTKNKDINENDRLNAKFLLEQGNWSDKPLNI